ncbi:hypothetical protein [Arthrobacter sp. UYCu712]|uniref:hypothetical protein n=1 Tax=Arthrobacter sp. UYCu712 TaxID=3156340 RepID=UPI00339203F5
MNKFATTPTHHQEQDQADMSPAKNTAATTPAETELRPAAESAIAGAGLRLVEVGETAPSTEELVDHYAALAVAAEQAAGELRSEASRFTAEADSAKAELRKLLEPGKHQSGNLTISITEPSRSTDWASFEKAYPVEVNPALYKSVVNAAAVPPNLKNQFMVAGTGERRVAIK